MAILSRFLSVICGVMLIVGITPSIAVPAAMRQDVVIGMIQEPDILNSVLTTTTAANFVIKAVMSFPVSYDKKWKLGPGIVESIPTLDNGGWKLLPGGKMQLMWKLKHGVKWSDGQDVTAADVLFTAAVARNPKAGLGNEFNCGFGDKIESVEAVDAYTVAVTWKQHYPFANDCLTDGGLLPRHILESAFQANPEKFKETTYGRDPSATITDGPYVMKSWTRGSEMVLEANPYYWRGKAAIDRVVIKFFNDANVLLANLVSGSIDLIPSGFIGLSFGSSLQLEQLIKSGRAPNLKVGYGPSLLFDSLTLNLDNPILKLSAIRQALAYATDREAISKSLYEGKQIPAYTPLPPSHPAYDPNLNHYPYNIRFIR